MSTVSSSRDERGRQKPLDKGTTEPAKQVKPAGLEQSVEPSSARDSGKSDVAVWEAVFERENMRTALKRVESNKGAAGVDGMGGEKPSRHPETAWVGGGGGLRRGK